VIGLGYVGLPLSVAFGEAGLTVTGFDIEQGKVASLKKGHSYIQDVPSGKLTELVESGLLTATSDFRLLAEMDTISITVPTPLGKTKDPDLSSVISAMEAVSAELRNGQLIVLESTTYPGTTREVALPILERKGLKVGEDFFLAYSPERIDPGNTTHVLKNTPKVLGGITKQCTLLAYSLYSQAIETVVRVSSPETAEMAKLLENTFRSVNIALVNEVAIMCDRLGINVWEVVEAASTKPFGFMPFYPGPGLGGHCLPVDPHYLSWKLRTLDYKARFVSLAEEVNAEMPRFVVDKITASLNEHRKSVKGSSILILGVTYKKDVADIRESPTLDIAKTLIQKGARVDYHDPYVAELKLGEVVRASIPLDAGSLRDYDAVVLTTDHSSFEMREILPNCQLLIDTRNATRGILSEKIIRL
jgi:UDP-N-acetyl-D-glucosamine dehydrogenase